MKVAIMPDMSLFDASFNGASKSRALMANHLLYCHAGVTPVLKGTHVSHSSPENPGLSFLKQLSTCPDGFLSMISYRKLKEKKNCWQGSG